MNPNALAAANSGFNSAFYAIDGDSTTGWNAVDYATPSKPYILTVDIGKVFPVNRIVLKSGDSDYPSDYYINYMLSISVDNVNWLTLVPFDQLIDSADGYFDVVDIETKLMRYARFVVLGGTHWAHLAEMEIWGEPDAVELPTIAELLERIESLESQLEDLQVDLRKHTHSYLTGKGNGHNNTEAETGPASIPVRP